MTYKKMYEFEVADESWITEGYTDFGDELRIFVKETRCNGQEDTHMCGEFVKPIGSDSWIIEDEEYVYTIKEYGGDNWPDLIVEFLNQNPPPKAEE